MAEARHGVLRPDQPTPVGQQAEKRLRVLVVDDHPADLQLCELLLCRSFPYVEVRVTAPQDAQCAGDIDCVLLADRRQSVSTQSLIDCLRSSPGKEFLPIVVLSDCSDQSRAAVVLRAGANDYLSKECLDASNLTRCVVGAIEHAKSSRVAWLERQALRQTNAELRRQCQEVQTLYRRVSHDMKSPLTAIREITALVADGVLGEVTGQQAEALATSIKCCDSLTELINKVDDAANMQADTLDRG